MHDKTRQDNVTQDKTLQYKTRQSKTIQYNTRHDNIITYSIRHEKTRQTNPRWNDIGLDPIRQDSMIHDAMRQYKTIQATLT